MHDKYAQGSRTCEKGICAYPLPQIHLCPGADSGILNPLLDTTTHRKIKIGTCAWSYDDWRGIFYPTHLVQNQWLEFYSRYLPAVEVDSTFYHSPAVRSVAHWVQQTPEDFRFCCKMPKQITHELRLRDCEEPLNAFLEALEPLRPKLGSILIQLPPGFVPQRDEKALKHFFTMLPSTFRFAVEFRHADWHLPRIVHFLEDHNLCWAWTDTSKLNEQNRGAFEPLPQTTNFLYIRLLGDIAHKYHAGGGKLFRYGSLMWPRDSSIENWTLKIQKHLDASEHVYLNCSNHFEGYAALTAQRIGRLLGIPIDIPVAAVPVEPQKQLNLL